MAPIEVIRGSTPEEIKEKFNQKWEPEGWKPFSSGTDSTPDQSQFLVVYRSPKRFSVVVSPSAEIKFEPVTVELTQEKIEKARNKIGEVFSRGKLGPTALDRFRNKAIKEGQGDALVLLFPEPSNQPMSRFFLSLHYRGQIETVTDLLNFPSREYIYGVGEKGHLAIEEVKKILLEK